MNDTPCIGCFWWECGACDGADLICDEAVLFNSEKYIKFHDDYEYDVEQALIPVAEKWKTIFNDESNRCDVK